MEGMIFGRWRFAWITALLLITLANAKAGAGETKESSQSARCLSSKACSQFGNITARMPMKQRAFDCAACGLVMERDQNAARLACYDGQAAKCRGCFLRHCKDRREL